MSLKILLADDSMTAQNMGKKILVDAGYDVVAVSNGAAAIKKIASDRPDIIILDVYMPGYTGLEVCERVKGASETSRTPVLLTVGKMEPFKPEEANRVRADGVMIKPFEATDLIAAIQSIANKMSASAPARHDPTVRIAPPMASLDNTILISPPAHEDTVRIPSPRSAQATPAYEETLRLTPEQIRAFQDKSYKDWVASAEVDGEPKASMPEDTPDEALFGTGVRDLDDDVPVEPVEASSPSILEPMEVSVAEPEADSATPIMPGLDSSESHMARAMAGTMAGHDFFNVTPSPAIPEQQSADAPAMYSGAEEVAAEAPSQPFFTLQQHAEPEPIEVVPEVPVMMETPAPELETSAPVSPGPSFVAQLEELEPTIAPSVEVDAVAAPELEVNSPIFVQHEVEVTTDPALITTDDDMSQFVTKFGQESAEEVHVGMASDLPPEQMAALMTPESALEEPEIVQEVPVLEDPEIFVPRMVELEAPAPVLQEPVALTEEPEAHIAEAHSVLEEVGAIEPEAALTGTGPTIAYVPSIEDTQPIPPYVEPAVSVEQVEELPEPEPAMVVPEPEPVAEPEAVFAVASQPVEEAAAAVAHEEHVSAVHLVEAAAAAVVGGAALTEAAHFFTVSEPALATEEHPLDSSMPAIEESPYDAKSELTIEPNIPAPSEAPVQEPVGDAALAEELAAALADKEAEEHAAAAAQAAIASTIQPVVAEAAEAASPEHLIADAKLGEAVSRALEKLRPQLIAEIMRELFK